MSLTCDVLVFVVVVAVLLIVFLVDVVVAMFACCQINAFDTSAIFTYTQFTYTSNRHWGIYRYSMNNFTAYNLFIIYIYFYGIIFGCTLHI